jgi:acetyl-CoA decarbonylase/synthase complex subunit delta
MSKESMEDYVKKLLEALGSLKELELESLTFEAEELEFFIQPFTAMPRIAPKLVEKPSVSAIQLVPLKFEPPLTEYVGKVSEVTIGATKSQGGTRDYTKTIGGESSPPFNYFNGNLPHRPLVSFDVFDMKLKLPKAVRNNYGEVMEDPAEWAKLCVNKFGAEMVTIHLISTDPLIKGTSPTEAAKTVENVLQAVNVPVGVGSAGVPEVDPKVLAKASEVAEGERVLISSANLDNDYTAIAEKVKEHGHVLLSWTQMDINNQKKLNRELLDILPPDQIIMDPTTGALGYGLEYTFSIMERIRLGALLGDKDLQMPIMSGTSNSWAAREAWMKNEEWGPRALRGPLWEAVTALTLLMAGCDFFMMLNPTGVQTLEQFIDKLANLDNSNLNSNTDWVTLGI